MWICDFVWSDDLKLSLRRPESLTRVKLKETSHTKVEPLVHLMAIMAQFASIYLSFMLIILFSARPGKIRCILASSRLMRPSSADGTVYRQLNIGMIFEDKIYGLLYVTPWEHPNNLQPCPSLSLHL